MSENKDSQEYVGLRRIVLNKFDWKICSARKILSAERSSIAINLPLSISSITTKHDFISVQTQTLRYLLINNLLLFLKLRLGH